MAISGVQTSRATSPQHELDAVLRAALKSAVAVSQLSREQIADALGARLGRAVSPATVDTWIAVTKSAHHLPADAVPVLCEILKDDTLQRQLLSPEMRKWLELGEYLCKEESRLQNALAHLQCITQEKR
jgi:hypothetical protein